MKNILVIIDKLLCRYLGLDKAEIIPHFVRNKYKDLIISNTESFKRHTQETSISNINLSTVNKRNKEKLGIAVGKAIANNLIVSFDEITIKSENKHAR